MNLLNEGGPSQGAFPMILLGLTDLFGLRPSFNLPAIVEPTMSHLPSWTTLFVFGKIRITHQYGGALHPVIGLESLGYSSVEASTFGTRGGQPSGVVLCTIRTKVGWVAGDDYGRGAACWASWGMRGAIVCIIPASTCTWS